MTAHREVQPQRCEKCNGTGRVPNIYTQTMEPCPHLRRTDVTGLSDDEETILALRARVADLETALTLCAAECEAEAGKASEAALERAARLCDAEEVEWREDGHKYASREEWPRANTAANRATQSAVLASEIRALKDGGA